MPARHSLNMATTDLAISCAGFFHSTELKFLGTCSADLARSSSVSSVSGDQRRTDVLVSFVFGQMNGDDFRPDLRDGLLQLEQDDVVSAVIAVRATGIRELVADDVLDSQVPLALLSTLFLE